MESLERCEFGWFIRSGPKALDGKPGIVVRPLTARYHAPYFFNFQRSLIMSATIGDFNTFAGELGISDFVSRRNKNPWPPEHRPIYDLGAPRIGRKSTPADYEEQAKLIANAIAQCDESWPGLIHVTSIEEAERLYYRLKTSGKAGLNYRVFLCPRASTNEAVEAWKERKKVVPNSIMVSWMLWEGYDGVDEKINIVAKVPYPNIGDLYERERMRFDGKFFLQRTAWQFIQGLGRTRRSAEDYDVSGQNGFVAIADGNWTRIRKYIPESILESIVKL
ncbi:MAG: hypothetical protein KatS3mg087_1835 [Patescibacteria group bacterium]|nr:MAG: hypothetical protein KatS3mg087_1835 [Patescibacteria group bacterium]